MTGLEGKEECFSNLDAVINSEWGRTAQAFWQVCEGVILAESMEECPVDKGRLRATAPACSHIEITPNEAVATLGYGTEYALRQHEDLSLHHPSLKNLGITRSSNGAFETAISKFGGGMSIEGGKAKYLEDPVRRNAPEMDSMIAAIMGGDTGAE